MVAKVVVEKFEVLLEPEEEGGYHIWCPRLPGCHSAGDTREEAIAHIKEAIEGWLEVARDFGHPLLDHDFIDVTTRTPASSPA